MPEDVDDSSGATVANADPGLWRAAVLPFEQGVDARTIMETLGHSQISLTLDTYSHVLPVLQRDAADRINRLLRA